MPLEIPNTNRFSYRCPRDAKTRELISLMSFPIALELAAEHLEIPPGEDLESLTARHWEIGIAIVGYPQTRQSSDRERVRAFMKEFLHLACRRPPAPPQSEAV